MARRTNRTFARLLTRLIVVALVALGMWLYQRYVAQNQRTGPAPSSDRQGSEPSRTGRSADLNLALGNPSRATADVSNADNYLIERPQFAESYNRSKGGPNWVSWHLVESDLGDVERGTFHPDSGLPAGWYRVKPNDYTRSGYDRGHLCPSADRDSTPENVAAVFTMINILPQAGDNNRGPWEKLESHSRTLVRRGEKLFIIAGGYGSRGTIADGKVNVPANTWKVIVALPPRAADDIGSIDRNTHVIAVDMPNEDGIKDNPWTQYQTTIRALERATGYDFLSNLPRNIQDALEEKSR